MLLIRAGTPNYTLGALCVVTRPDGALLLVRQSYRRAWFLPGGLVHRQEAPEVAVVREVREETGLSVVVSGQPVPLVEADRQVVTLVFRATVSLEEAAAAAGRSAEITALEWFMPDRLPPLEPEITLALSVLGPPPPHGS